MLYRFLGMSTGLGLFVLLGILITVSAGVAPARGALSMVMLLAGGSAVAIGLLTMIWHLNFRQGSEEVRNEWRSYMTYVGPLAAAVYLYKVAPLAHGTEAVDSKLVSPQLVLGLSFGSLLMTMLAARNLPPGGSLAPHEAALNYFLRLGGMIGFAGVAAGVGMPYWGSILWMLIPSFLALYLASDLPIEVAVALLGGGLVLTWSVSSLVRRFVPRT